VLAELADYERGAMGPVQHLPADLLAYLRIASTEREAWENYQQST